MNRDSKLIICIFALSFAALSSCTKKSNSSPGVAGTWKLSQFYIDTNHNGVMDAGELMTLDSSTATTRINFNSNGTFTDTKTYNSTPFFQGSWSLVNNNTYIKIVDTGSSGGTNYEFIQTLTSTSMVLKDTMTSVSGAISWAFFTK